MANRKEERERLRAERLAAQRSASSDERRRLILGYFVAGILGALVVAGIVVAVMNSGGGGGGGAEAEVNEAAGIDPATGVLVPGDITPDERDGTTPPDIRQGDLELAAKAADCELELGVPDEGSTHIAPDAKTPEYETDPPTSGDHSAEHHADGAYLDTPPPVNTLHSLEHGRVTLQYSPDLPEEEQLVLKGLFDSDPQGMLMFPNPDMPYAVATTAWTNLMGCDSYSPEVIDAIIDFRDTYRGQGPEDVPL